MLEALDRLPLHIQDIAIAPEAVVYKPAFDPRIDIFASDWFSMQDALEKVIGISAILNMGANMSLLNPSLFDGNKRLHSRDFMDQVEKYLKIEPEYVDNTYVRRLGSISILYPELVGSTLIAQHPKLPQRINEQLCSPSEMYSPLNQLEYTALLKTIFPKVTYNLLLTPKYQQEFLSTIHDMAAQQTNSYSFVSRAAWYRLVYNPETPLFAADNPIWKVLKERLKTMTRDGAWDTYAEFAANLSIIAASNFTIDSHGLHLDFQSKLSYNSQNSTPLVKKAF